MKFAYTAATAKGQRPYQEDRHIAFHTLNDGMVFAVADGHGGYTTAQYVVDILQNLWDAHAMANLGTPKTWLSLIVRRLAEDTEYFADGCTLSIVYVPPTEAKAYVAVLGDSPVIIKDAEGKIYVSPSHNVRSNLGERERAEGRGGSYYNGYIWFDGCGLQMTRGLGDTAMAKILNREPEIETVSLGPNSFILLATDGLFDPSHFEDAQAITDIVLLISGCMEAADLVKHALDIPTGDNVTAILARSES